MKAVISNNEYMIINRREGGKDRYKIGTFCFFHYHCEYYHHYLSEERH